MSFHKTHQYSNELAEVVVQEFGTAVRDLNSAGVVTLPFPSPAYKNYRVLEIGWVCTNNTASTALRNNVGTTNGGSELIAQTPVGAIDIPANSFGTVFSTNTAFDFNPNGAAVDADGVARLTAGQQIFFDVDTAAGAVATGILFVRLAPEIDRNI